MEEKVPVTPTPADDVSSKINSALSELDGDDKAPITETPKVTPKVEPPTPPAAPKPPEDVAKEQQASEPPADAAVAKPEADATPKETPDKPLLAGKYTNKYDLQAGVLEEAIVLKSDKKELVKLFTEADSTGDWSKVEAKYKELQTQVVKKIQDEKKPAETAQEVTPPKVETPETALSQDELKQVLFEQTTEQVANSRIASRMKELGIAIPKTDEELNALQLDYPAIYIEFTQTFQGTYRNLQTLAQKHMESTKQAPAFNNSQEEKSRQQIGDFAKQWDVPIGDVDKIIAEAKASKSVFDNKDGVDFIREDALFEWFMAKKAPEMLRAVKAKADAEKAAATQTATVEGRMQGAQDVEKNKAKAIQSISTSSTPASATTAKPVDFSDPKQAKAAGFDAVSKRLNDLLDSEEPG